MLMRYFYKMKYLIPLFLLGWMACDTTSEKTTATDGTPLVVYEGIIPCADCAGIRLELALDEASSLPRRAYRLTETYLGTTEKDSIFSRFGSYRVIRGNKQHPDIELYEIDPDLKENRYFIRKSPDTLLVADRQGNLIDSKLPYYLIQKP